MKPLHLEFAQSLRGPVTCQVQFENQEAAGPLQEVCNDIPLAI